MSRGRDEDVPFLSAPSSYSHRDKLGEQLIWSAETLERGVNSGTGNVSYHQTRAGGLTLAGLGTVMLQEQVGWDMKRPYETKGVEDRIKRGIFLN